VPDQERREKKWYLNSWKALPTPVKDMTIPALYQHILPLISFTLCIKPPHLQKVEKLVCERGKFPFLYSVATE
jgi:hypothetical protein